MDRNRNLIFGLLAAQLGKVKWATLIQISKEWAKDPSSDLRDRLLAAGALSKDDAFLLRTFVEQALHVYEDDSAAALKAFGDEVSSDSSDPVEFFLNSRGSLMVGPREERLREASHPSSLEVPLESPGRYRVRGEHARGGMGRILIAHDHHLKRDIAVKELLVDVEGARKSWKSTDSSSSRKSRSLTVRFLREARVTARLEHPSIVPVHELGRREDGHLYYTMKLLRGKTLADVLKEANSLQERLKLLPHFIDLCQALAYAHSQGVIHRDIKPSNIMVGEFGETVVIDWGLAKVRGEKDIHAAEFQETASVGVVDVEEEDTRTTYGQVLGTLCYMPPEQAEGNIDLVDERSDVYALGAVLYELLTKRPPFQHGNPIQLRYQVTHEEPETILSREPYVSRELVAICERAMAKDPDARYQSAKELAEEVGRFQSGGVVRAYEYHLSEYLWRFVKKHKTIVGTATAAIIVLMFMGTYSYLRVVKENRVAVAAEQRATREFYFASLAYAVDKTEWGRYDEAMDILGRCPEYLRGWEWGRAMYLCNQDLFSLDMQVTENRYFALAPAQDMVATPGPGNTIVLWDLNKGEEIRRFETPKPASPIEFTPDATHLVAAYEDGSGALWRVDTGEMVHNFDTPGATSAVIAPDGKRAARGWMDGRATIVDLFSGEELFNVKADSAEATVETFLAEGRQLLTGGVGDGVVRVWDCQSGTIVQSIDVPVGTNGKRGVTAAVSPDESMVATAGENPTIRIWDMKTRELIRTIEGHTDTVLKLVFSPDGRRLASCSEDRTVRLWNVSTGQEMISPISPPKPVYKAAFLKDGDALVTTGNGAKLQIWDTTRKKPDDTIALNDAFDGFDECAESPDYFAVAHKGQVLLINRNTGVITGRIEPGIGDIVSVKFSPDYSLLAMGAKRQLVSVWSVARNEEVHTFKRDKGAWVFGLAFSPDGKKLAMSGPLEVTPITVWDLETELQILAFPAGPAEMEEIAFSPDGKLIAGGDRGNMAYLWNASTGELIHRLEGHTDWVISVAFSPDGKYLATGGRYADGTVRVWNPRSGELVHVLAGQINRIDSVVFSPDSKRLFSADDKYVAVWDVDSGRQVYTLEGTDPMALSPDGRTLLTGNLNQDGYIIWNSFSRDMDDYPGDASTPFAERVELYKRAYWKRPVK